MSHDWSDVLNSYDLFNYAGEFLDRVHCNLKELPIFVSCAKVYFHVDTIYAQDVDTWDWYNF